MADTALFYVAANIAPVAAGGIADQEWEEDVEITDLDVSADFNDLDNITYALAPSSDALPAGLSLSGAGVISGTPTAAASDLSIVVRGSNDYGTDDTAFSLTVTEAAYDPVSALFGSSEQGILFDLLDASDGYLYQDSAKTTLVSADEDPIAAITDRSGNGNDLLQDVNTNFRLAYIDGGGIQSDGISQYLATGDIDLSGGCDLTIIMAVKAESTGAGRVCLLGHEDGPGSWQLYSRESGGDIRFDFVTRPAGTGGDVNTYTDYFDVASGTYLVTCTLKESTGKQLIRVDGVELASDTRTLTGGTFSDAPIYYAAQDNGGVQDWAKAKGYAFTVVDKCLTGTALTDAEADFAAKAGITL
jgi:hypothetical protein